MSQVKDFCERYEFEQDAVEYLENAYLKLKENNDIYESFASKIKFYEENYERDFSGVFDEIEAMSKDTGIHKYTLDLLYLICLTPILERFYTVYDINKKFYDASVLDLKWKALECKQVYGVWGTFVGWWTIGFFKLKRFGMGRLQFNLKKFSKDYGTDFKEGDTYIDVHIPSSGPLNYEDCQEAYNMAAEFFKKDFDQKPIVFGCHSWLLSSDNYEILPPYSNVLAFMKDYTILEEEKDPTNNNVWRIFSRFDLPKNIDELPQDTSLQRAFAKWLAKGNTINVAFGVIVR